MFRSASYSSWTIGSAHSWKAESTKLYARSRLRDTFFFWHIRCDPPSQRSEKPYCSSWRKPSAPAMKTRPHGVCAIATKLTPTGKGTSRLTELSRASKPSQASRVAVGRDGEAGLVDVDRRVLRAYGRPAAG